MSDVTDTDREKAGLRQVLGSVYYAEHGNVTKMLDALTEAALGWRPGGAPVSPTREQVLSLAGHHLSKVVGWAQLDPTDIHEKWTRALGEFADALIASWPGERREDVQAEALEDAAEDVELSDPLVWARHGNGNVQLDAEAQVSAWLNNRASELRKAAQS